MSQRFAGQLCQRAASRRSGSLPFVAALVTLVLAELTFLVPSASAVDGVLDTTFDTDGTLTTAFSGTATLGEAANAVVVQPDGKIVAAGGSGADLAMSRYATGGGLDTSFDGDGKLTDAVAKVARGMAVQPDGKIVTVGGVGGTFKVARYNADGSIDDGGINDTTAGDSFGITGGRVVTNIGPDAVGRAVAVQADGKILAVGYADADPTSASARFDFVLARYLRNGALDQSFGMGGLVRTSQLVAPLDVADYHGNQASPPHAPRHNFAHAVVVQPSGRIVVAGRTRRFNLPPTMPPTPPDDDFVLVGYLPNGELDPTFGTANIDVVSPGVPPPLVGGVGTGRLVGKTVTDLGSTTDIANAVALHADGRIEVAGESAGKFAIARYNRDGVLAHFGTYDIDANAATADVANAVTVQADDKVVVVGDTGTGCAVARTSAASVATLDTGGFNSPSGKVTQTSCGYNAVALQSNGKVVVAGANGTGTDFRVDRYDSAGIAAPLGIGISDVSMAEGMSSFVFTVTAPASTQTVTVDYSTEAGTAAAEVDFVSTSGKLVFPPSTTSQLVVVPVNPDLVVEASENFFVNLFWPTNAAINDHRGVGTITNDDVGTSSLTIADLSANEGGSLATTFAFNVTRSAPPPLTPNPTSVTVDYTIVYGTGAVSGVASSSDFLAPVGSSVVFGPSETSKQITVVVNGDVIAEPNETFHVFLSEPVNATIADGLGLGTILNDD